MFGLLEKQLDGSYKFIGLCALEIKTRSALDAADALYKKSLDGNKWTECSADTPALKQAVPEPAYRSQLCQHATALGLMRVLMVYSVPGGLPMKMVLLTVSREQRHTLLTLQQLAADKYMPFFYGEGLPCRAA